MKMSYAQKAQFFEEGYIVIPGAVPQVAVRAADRVRVLKMDPEQRQ